MRTARSIRHRLLWLSISSFIATLLLTPATTAQEPDSETEPSPDAAFLIQAAKSYGIGESTQELWHLRVSFQLFDAQGSQIDNGMWEETANSFSLRKAIFEARTFHQTRYVGPGGTKVVGDLGQPPSYFEMLRSAIVSPMLDERFMEQTMENIAVNPANNGTLTTEYRIVDGASLHCYDLSIPTTTYCFDDSDVLTGFSTGQPFFCQGTYKNLVRYEERLVPADLAIECKGAKLLIAHLESIESIGAWDQSLFAPPADAQPINLGVGRAALVSVIPSEPGSDSPGLRKAANLPAGPIRMAMSASDANGRLLHRAEPVYPPDAKAAGISGTVVLQISIDSSGKPDSMQVISGPTMLQQAALDAVKQWRYRPFLVHNRPVEVETTVNVIFALPTAP
jgi:TonB family protein